jgi:hypothetical protein
MRNLVLVVYALLCIANCDIQGGLLYEDLFEQCSFTYKIASGIEINYFTTENTSATEGFTLVTENSIDFDQRVEENKWMIIPFTGYSFAIAYNLPILGNQTLRLTENVIRRIIAEEANMFWSDPEITEFNPLLSSYNVLIRMIFDSETNDINKYLIDHFFDNQTDNPGTWTGIKASRNRVVNGFINIVPGVALLPNSIAFAQRPSLEKDNSGKLHSADLLLVDQIWYTNYTIWNATQVENETIYESQIIIEEHISYITVNISQTPSIVIKSTENNVIRVGYPNVTRQWPLNQIIYVLFERNYPDCIEATSAERFLYWMNNGTALSKLFTDNGFFDIGYPNKLVVQYFLKTATCTESGRQRDVLIYTNLTESNRSNIVLGFSIILSLIFIWIVGYAYTLQNEPKKNSPVILIFHLIVTIGLLFMLASYFLYWLTPSSTGVCIARYWTLSVGYINVISSIFVWAITVHYFLNAHAKGVIPKFSYEFIAITYLLLNSINIVILIIWNLVGNPRSVELVVNPFSWETIYDCKVDSDAPDYTRSGYYLLVSIAGCFLIYRLWAITEGHKTKDDTISNNSRTRSNIKPKSPDDMRFLMAALYNQIIVFVLTFVLSILNISDAQEYIIVIPLFLISSANAVLSLFLQRILRRIKKKVSSKGKSTEEEIDSRGVSLPKYGLNSDNS